MTDDHTRVTQKIHPFAMTIEEGFKICDNQEKTVRVPKMWRDDPKSIVQEVEQA